MAVELKQALEELRKQEKRKFNQTLDLLISLKGIDLRKDNISLITNIPHPFKEKKVCAFLEARNSSITTITKPEFDKYKDKNSLKKLVREYDFFIANAKLMPSVASTFGKALGPLGKMPSPQLGIITNENTETIKQALDKISKAVKIRLKEPAIKIAVGKESMPDNELISNIKKIYEDVINVLPSKKDNIRKTMLKFTMTKPLAISV